MSEHGRNNLRAMKLKTNRSAIKRFKFSGKGKVMRRPTKQNHFNAKDNGHESRAKSGTMELAKNNLKDIKNLMPYQTTV